MDGFVRFAVTGTIMAPGGRERNRQMRVRSGLLALALCIAANVQADERLAALLAGTEVTPPLSGLQVSLVEAGAAGEGFSYALLSSEAGTPSPRSGSRR